MWDRAEGTIYLTLTTAIVMARALEPVKAKYKYKPLDERFVVE